MLFPLFPTQFVQFKRNAPWVYPHSSGNKKGGEQARKAISNVAPVGNRLEKNKQIDAITVEAMNNGAHYMFMYHVSTRASEIEVIGQKMPDYLSSLQAAVVTEDKCLVLSQKSLLSDKLKEADKLRDDYYRAFKKAVKGSEGIPVPAIQEAAVILLQVLKDYNINPSGQLDKETGLLMNLLDDLMGKNKTQMEALGLMPLIKKLKWREVFSFRGLWGSLTDKNNPRLHPEGLYRFPATTYEMNQTPYMEASVGIENIFKFLRVDYVWRLTYLEHEDIQKSGVRMTMALFCQHKHTTMSW